MPLERELKLTGSLPDFSNVSQLGGYQLRYSHQEAQTNTYYDTLDLRLGQAGMTLRLRRFAEGGGVYTWKGRSLVRDGWHQKQELEVSALEATNLDGLRDPEILAELHAVTSLTALAPVVSFQTLRRVYELQGVGELALDQVTVLRSDGSIAENFSELELELKTAITDAALEPVVDALRGFGLQPSNLPKSTRALRAVGLGPG